MATRMGLPAFHVTKTTSFTIKADYPLTLALAQYKQFYREVHDADVSEADLLREMAREFMAADRGFKRFQAEKNRAAKKQPTSQPIQNRLERPNGEPVGAIVQK